MSSKLQMPEHARKENAFLCGVIAQWCAKGGKHKLPSDDAEWWLHMHRKGLTAEQAVDGVLKHVVGEGGHP